MTFEARAALAAATWAVFGIVGFLVLRTRDPVRGRRRWRAWAIVGPPLYLGTGMLALGGPPLALLAVVPAGLLVGVMNLNNVHFCRECGAMTYGRRSRACSRCRAPLPRS